MLRQPRPVQCVIVRIRLLGLVRMRLRLLFVMWLAFRTQVFAAETTRFDLSWLALTLT